MDIEIRKLTPDLAEDYAHFFDVTPHDINEDEAKCYCVTWRSDASYADEGHWFPTREDRRAHAIHFIKTAAFRAIWPIAVMKSWDGATPTGIVNIASITCVPPGRLKNTERMSE